MHNLQIYLFNLFIFLKNTDEPKKKKLMIRKAVVLWKQT